ncbi:MAG: hypothetical protein OZ948_10240 [Deltaproteobacteria bacterium]|nr:hypothetical protein [Deltaproteobacteria bacterium]
MRLVSLLGLGSFALVSLWVGGRLLALAARTRQAPETALGTALFFGAGLGYALAVGARQLEVLPHEWVGAIRLAGIAFIHVGSAALAFGAWRIFRPAERWAKRACLVIVAGLAATLALRTLDPPTATQPVSSPLHFWPTMLLGAAAYGWCAFESARYAAALRRRARFGLASPALARRFALWAAAGAGAVGIHLCNMVNRFIDPVTVDPAILMLTSALGLGAAVTLWLAFFPPAWWPARTVPSGS